MLENKKMKVCVEGRYDVRMTSSAQRHCVKDTPASKGPPECVIVCVSRRPSVEKHSDA